MSNTIHIDITSDTICPWCYIGKNRLARAIKAYKTSHPDTTFTITWHAYYLNPDAPTPGVDKLEFYHAKFGPERTRAVFEKLSQLGAAEGIAFKFGGRTGNTRDSHRLVQLGKTRSEEVQQRVVEELFAAYFENERDVTDREILVECGVRAGLDREEVSEWLRSGKGGAEVDREVEDAKRQGVTGVPNFVVQGRYEIGGAQEPEAFTRIFDKVVAVR